MKYSKRELKSFNLFALFMFGVGGFIFTLGVIELAMKPTVEYVISESRRNVGKVQEMVSTNAPVTTRKYSKPQNDRVTVEGTNLRAVSNTLIGVVLMALSFALNRVLLRVIRHDGEDTKSKPLRKSRK